MSKRFTGCLLALLTFSLPGLCSSLATADDAGREKFFEEKVRPLLIQRCASCHGPEKQQGELRLDQRVAVIGANPGEGLVVPGKPDDSRLVQVIRYTAGETQMPPTGKMPQAEIDILTQWITDGAYWPTMESGSPSTPVGLPRTADGQWDFRAIAGNHWAFQPIKSPELPAINEMSRTNRPMDRFILKKLEETGLTMSPEADRRKLAKRLWFDLIGIPAPYEEVERFANDPSPDAYEKLVDHLLASPLYGERWGRHWLDVARYADTKGYVFTDNKFFPFSFTYRDYVIRSFNEDKPYNRFLMEQLAADQLGLPEGDESLAALGFLTVGRRYLNNQQDIIDDRIDVVTRGLMGLSVSCARCHDHKFDPVPTADYYSLYGVFASSNEPAELPLIGKIVESPEYTAYLAELDKHQKGIDAYVAKTYAEVQGIIRERSGDYLQAILKTGKLLPEGLAVAYEHGEPEDKFTARWRDFLGTRPETDPVLAPWKRLTKAVEADFPAALKAVLDDQSLTLNPRVREVLTTNPPANVVELAKAYGRLFTTTHQEWQADIKDKTPAPEALENADSEQIRLTIYGDNSATGWPLSQAEKYFARNHNDHLRGLRRGMADVTVNSPGAPARAMVMHDNPTPHEPVIFVRGNAGRPGDKVPRRFPQILAPEGTPFTQGSGRLELARKVTEESNPLTARVIANRVWMLHFGSPLVASPSDFGVRSDAPTHPELLDYLASYLIRNNWSIKELHREILLSATWKQDSQDRAEARSVDPENSTYWRMNRRRREFESQRDAWLAAAGRLSPQMFGRPVDIEKQPFTGRRTIYELVDRNNLPGLLRTFDFPTPDTSSAQRPQTTVPQQALYGMNSPFVQEMAAALAARTADIEDSNARISRIVQLSLSRDATPEEQATFGEVLKNGNLGWPEVAQVLLMSNEFAFAD